MRIRKRLEIMMVICFMLLFISILSMICTGVYIAVNHYINPPQERQLVKPQIEPIRNRVIEYADDDPEIKREPEVIKEPPDIIEEDEDEILDEVINNESIVEIPYPEVPLTSAMGKVQGPQEVETYYNLPMNKVLEKMRELGYTEEEYPYYVREDGMKMIGDYIMVATDLNTMYPRGTIVQTSRGQGIVCDHCETPDIIDLAVEW